MTQSRYDNRLPSVGCERIRSFTVEDDSPHKRHRTIDVVAI
jgi:hypothetical protein